MIRFGIIRFALVNDTETSVFSYGFYPLRSTTEIHISDRFQVPNPLLLVWIQILPMLLSITTH